MNKDLFNIIIYVNLKMKVFIGKTLESCRPASMDLTWWGRTVTEFNLGRKDYFGSLLGIDANTKSTKRTLWIIALKTVAKCICAGYNEEGLWVVN